MFQRVELDRDYFDIFTAERSREEGREGGWHIEDFAFIGDIGACAYCQDASDKDDNLIVMKVR